MISEPFERIAMDIVGSLQVNHHGNHYVLVVCDYVTWYLVAVPWVPVMLSTSGQGLGGSFSYRGAKGGLDRSREQLHISALGRGVATNYCTCDPSTPFPTPLRPMR